jgi:hypothetical protein
MEWVELWIRMLVIKFMKKKLKYLGKIQIKSNT